MTEVALYQWPNAARFGRVVPKSKFYEHGKLSGPTRQKFVDEVLRITWAYKLAESTVNLRGDDTFSEIQVFVIEAKGDDVGDEVLGAIDRSVAFPMIFEIVRNDGDESETRVAALNKLAPSQKTRKRNFFATPWHSAETPRVPLPSALDLRSLYTGLLARLLPIELRPGEQLAEADERVTAIRKLEREILTLEGRLRNEPQFNRKVELRRQLKGREATLTALTAHEESAKKNENQKDRLWTS